MPPALPRRSYTPKRRSRLWVEELKIDALMHESSSNDLDDVLVKCHAFSSQIGLSVPSIEVQLNLSTVL